MLLNLAVPVLASALLVYLVHHILQVVDLFGISRTDLPSTMWRWASESSMRQRWWSTQPAQKKTSILPGKERKQSMRWLEVECSIGGGVRWGRGVAVTHHGSTRRSTSEDMDIEYARRGIIATRRPTASRCSINFLRSLNQPPYSFPSMDWVLVVVLIA